MKILRSFQAKLLAGFLVVTFILALWLVFEHSIERRAKKLDEQASTIALLQTDYLMQNRNLYHFLLTGYHRPDFYTNRQQNELDTLERDLHTNRRKIAALAVSIGEDQMPMKAALHNLVTENKALVQQIRELKVLYRKKGFKDFGAEGEMRVFAHRIEDAALIPKTEILQLRRHEKDFLLRGELKYADRFFALVDRLIKRHDSQAHIRKALLDYKNSFQVLSGYFNQVGLYTSKGLYYRIQQQSNKILQSYMKSSGQLDELARRSKQQLRQFSITGSFAFLLLLILATWQVAKYLSREVKELNRIILAYIHAGFKTGKKQPAFSPTILEVETIHRSFHLLTKKLDIMLQERADYQKQLVSAVLEGQEKERKFIGAELHDNINPLLATVKLYLTTKAEDEEHQQQLVKEAVAILDQSIREIRKLSHTMVGTSVHQISLRDSLQNLFLAVESGASLTIRFYSHGFDESRLSEEQKVTLYRIAQEQMTNIVKHAHAKNVAVLLEEKDNLVKFIIKDDGEGFDSSQQHRGIGLRNMETRLEILNGNLLLHTRPQQGCELIAVLPVTAPKAAVMHNTVIKSEGQAC